MRDHIIHASRRSGRSKRRDRHLFLRGLRNPRARCTCVLCVYSYIYTLCLRVYISVYYTIIIILYQRRRRRLRHLVRERRRVLCSGWTELRCPNHNNIMCARGEGKREGRRVQIENGTRKQKKKNKVRNPPQKRRGRYRTIRYITYSSFPGRILTVRP